MLLPPITVAYRSNARPECPGTYEQRPPRYPVPSTTATRVNHVPAMSDVCSTHPRTATPNWPSYSDFVRWLEETNRVRPAHSSLHPTVSPQAVAALGKPSVSEPQQEKRVKAERGPRQGCPELSDDRRPTADRGPRSPWRAQDSPLLRKKQTTTEQTQRSKDRARIDNIFHTAAPPTKPGRSGESKAEPR